MSYITKVPIFEKPTTLMNMWRIFITTLKETDELRDA